ncbi:MAG TPA: V-type ATPase 116kDa subunit family protein [Deltaproteobacteria bacterium]|nr:V-type ATPase 116kDa subunit family protein [Deltaproteobacteria bacterium]
MIPMLINFPEPMYKMRLASLKDDTETTLMDLQTSGMLHVEPAGKLSSQEQDTIRVLREQVSLALSRIQDILSALRGEREILVPESTPTKTTMEMVSLINEIHARYLTLSKDRTALQERISDIASLIRYLSPLAANVDLSFEDLNYSGEYLFTKVLVFSAESHKQFLAKASPGLIQNISAEVAGETVTLIVARTDQKKTIMKLALDLGAMELRLPDREWTLSRFFKEHRTLQEDLAGEIEEIDGQLETLIEENLDDTVYFREVLSQNHDRLLVLEQLSYLHYATVIEGWVPVSRADEMRSSLEASKEYHFLEMIEPEEKEEPPTKLKNPPIIRPFQVIVNLFSIPRYGDWDPTPVVAYFFAFFFGLMLNDAIYALGLLAVTRFFLDKLVDDPASPNVHLFRNVLYIGGTVGLIFGLLSGTYLGDFLNKYFAINLESLAMATWVQKQLSDPITFIVIALIVGIIHVNTAHILSLIRGVREKNIGLILSKIGLFITEVFGIPYLFWSLLNIPLLPVDAQVYASFAYPLATGLVLIVISAFMQMGYLGALFWIFDLTGILGDIMSYSRLAGVGLATYYLASSFNLLADWFSSILAGIIPGIAGFIVAFIVGTVLLVVLHTFNMLLSSLAAFIHSLRLCFVEFLMKFYEGGGREYAPLMVRHYKKVVVGTRS